MLNFISRGPVFTNRQFVPGPVAGSRRPWVFGPRSSARHVPIVLGNCTFIILSVVVGGGGVIIY